MRSSSESRSRSVWALPSVIEETSTHTTLTSLAAGTGKGTSPILASAFLDLCDQLGEDGAGTHFFELRLGLIEQEQDRVEPAHGIANLLRQGLTQIVRLIGL